MMQPEQLQRLMRLARKTNNPLVVTDPEGQTPFVLMDIDRYEALENGGAQSPAPTPTPTPAPTTNDERRTTNSSSPELESEPEAFTPEPEVFHTEGEEEPVEETIESPENQGEDTDEWAIDELPEEFFSEPPLEEVKGSSPKVDFAPPYEKEMIKVKDGVIVVEPIKTEEKQEEIPEITDEDPGEEQFYLEPID